MDSRITPVILAGGKGTRLWPSSRAARPKQFLNLTSEMSLFQHTLERVSDPARFASPIIITNDEYRFLVAEQAQEAGIDPAAILLEPVARNTAPAIAAAAVHATAQDPEALLLVLPSDHQLIRDEAYEVALATALAAAASGDLVTFGITPTAPNIGFGYIESGAATGQQARKVVRFVEKPDISKAREMLEAGGYYWNSGMFLFGARTFLSECEHLAPEALSAARTAVGAARRDLDFIRLDAESFAAAPDISVDYAIFEKTSKAVVVPAALVWSDLGSWDAVWKSGARDSCGNVTRGAVTLENAKHSLVYAEHLHVAVQGLEDVAVVASEDAVYVGRLSKAQNVGELVKRLKADPGTMHLTETHLTCYRPWGGYASVLNGERFQVKKLFVKPGKRLSLQKHHHRSEHWIVVQGTAEVTIGETVRSIGENESVYIPRGELHRLANPGKIQLELIEVQTGSYLGEDDIIRVQDEFGRT